ncbi:hypothetical protein HZS_3123 [Henneguya salminicola]|nr:hypothetical protein HZS_3123 [Henneguya salminicola]
MAAKGWELWLNNLIGDQNKKELNGDICGIFTIQGQPLSVGSSFKKVTQAQALAIAQGIKKAEAGVARILGETKWQCLTMIGDNVMIFKFEKKSLIAVLSAKYLILAGLHDEKPPSGFIDRVLEFSKSLESSTK